MTRKPPGIARFDSAAAMVQALGSFLNGRDAQSLSHSPLLDRAMPLINLLPRSARELAYSIGGVTEAIGERSIRGLRLDRISEWIVRLLPRRTYPAAFVGSSNGALVHIAALLGVPWLPQTFLCPVRQLGTDPDDPRQSLAAGQKIVDAFLESHPGISIHQMCDPNQDRLMLKGMGYYRLKHRQLPHAYRGFLTQHLSAGATRYIDDCTISWPITRTSERSVFQFGALGGASVDEYFHGSERVREYLERYGIRQTRWYPPEPNDIAPEAEWGFDQSLVRELHSLAHANDWRLARIKFQEPESFSFLAALVYRDWYRKLGFEPARLIVDNFILMDPYRTLRLHALPFWLLFSVDRSAVRLQQFLDREPPFDEIDLMLFSHGTEGVGLAPIGTWRDLLAKAQREGRFLGVDETRYPRDFATFIRFHYALEKLGLPFELPPPCPLQRFESVVRQHGSEFGVQIETMPLEDSSATRRGI
jgi:hypothetical protein